MKLETLLPLLVPGNTFVTRIFTIQHGNSLPARSIVTFKNTTNVTGLFCFTHDEKEFYFYYHDIERLSVNMDICLPGQVLISKNGNKYVFVKKDNSFQDFPYRLSSLEDFTTNGPDYYNCSRTVEGWTFRNRPLDNDEDIVEITNERVFTFEQVKVFLEENSYVLLYHEIGLISFNVNENDKSITIHNNKDIYRINPKYNPTIILVDSTFFVHDSVENQQIQFQILTVKSNF